MFGDEQTAIGPRLGSTVRQGKTNGLTLRQFGYGQPQDACFAFNA
jgi:hypothetical protein